MRILLDECVNAGIKPAFRGHAVKTVAEMGWRGSTDSSLLTLAPDLFDIFVTIDQKLERQHEFGRIKLGFIIVHVPNNEIQSYQPLFQALLEAAATVKAGKVVHVYSHP